jgi:hypothetical protein
MERMKRIFCHPDEGEVVRWEIGMIHYNNIRAKGEH